MTEQDMNEIVKIFEEELKLENLPQQENFEVKMSVIALILLLQEAGFPFISKHGITSLRMLLRGCELVYMKNNENKTN